MGTEKAKNVAHKKEKGNPYSLVVGKPLARWLVLRPECRFMQPLVNMVIDLCD
jgi:hypothetical protein